MIIITKKICACSVFFFDNSLVFSVKGKAVANFSVIDICGGRNIYKKISGCRDIGPKVFTFNDFIGVQFYSHHSSNVLKLYP